MLLIIRNNEKKATAVYTEQMRKQVLKTSLLIILLLFVITTAFYAALLVESNVQLQEFISKYGFSGAIITAFIASLNALLPIPPATFAPIYLAAGLSHLEIIICFTIGASLADSLSFVFGWFGRAYSQRHQLVLILNIENFFQTHRNYILPVSYTYMALAPFPNEYIMIPLALAGYRYKHLFIPLVLGNLFYNTWTVYGFESLLDFIL